MCSDPESTVISHRRTYLKRDDESDIKQTGRQDPLWTTMSQKDLLLESFENTHSVDEVLSLVSRHRKFMRQKHIKMAFYALKVHVKSGDDVSRITESNEFGLLCKATVKLIRTMKPKEVLIILSRLIDFRIPPESLIFKSTIQMLRHEMNDMYADTLLILDRMLFYDIDKKHPADSDATVAALRIALPMVLEIRLKNNEFDPDDVSAVTNFLRLAIVKNMSADVVNKLMVLIKTHSDRLTLFQFPKIISCLMSHRIDSISGADKELAKDLLNSCVKKFVDSIRNGGWSRFAEGQVIDLFWRCFEGQNTFYSKEFFDLVVEAHLRRNKGTSDLVDLAKKLMPFDYVSMDLNQQICENLSQNPVHKTGFSIGVLSPLIAASDFEPSCGWDRVIENTLDDHMMSESAFKSTFQYLKTLESMAFVGRYNRQYYGHLINALTVMTQRPVPLGTVGQRLLNIRMALEHDEHDLPQEEVTTMFNQLEAFVQESIRVLNPIRKKETSTSSSLRESLVKALGGEDFMRSGVWGKDGQYHDYVVVMRKGDYPVAIGKEVLELNFISDIKLPDQCKL